MNDSIGQKKVSAGAVVLVLFLLAAGFVAILVKMGRSDDRQVETALSIMRGQVAADIDLKVDPRAARVSDQGGAFYFVCGDANLNRPNAGELTLDNVTQRYIVTVNAVRKGGTAKFDGSSTEEGRAEFVREWDEKCAAAEKLAS